MSLDETNRSVTFYLYNLSGQIVGYQRYRPDVSTKKINNDEGESRYYTYLPSGVDGVFGLEQLNPQDRTIYIVEGIFKAAVLHRLGYNSIAVLSCHPKRLRPWFKIMKQTWNLVAIGDPDDAGKKLVNTLKRGFQSPYDLDEMNDEEIHQLLKQNS